MLRTLVLVGLCLVVPGAPPAAAGSSSAATALAEANNDFTFKGRPIHPGLVKEFQNWASDYRPPITVTVDVGAAHDSNQYADAVTPRKEGGVSVTLGDGGEQFFLPASWPLGQRHPRPAYRGPVGRNGDIP
jgi:hypothetical protein